MSKFKLRFLFFCFHVLYETIVQLFFWHKAWQDKKWMNQKDKECGENLEERLQKDVDYVMGM